MENIMVVKTELLTPFLKRTGLVTENLDDIAAIVAENHIYMPRPEAENDPGWKQPIPYVAIIRGDEVFATSRLKKGTETRLHGLLSLGVGGHINPADDAGGDAFAAGLTREIHEEVYLDDFGALTFRGVINDDSNAVGSVHVGFFYTLETTGRVSVRETEKLAGQWIKIIELSEFLPKMETWSQIVAPEILSMRL